MSSLDAAGCLSALQSVFQGVGSIGAGTVTSQGVAPPTAGTSAQIWAMPPFKLVPSRSGLASVAQLLTFNARILVPIGSPPADDMDVILLGAYSDVMNVLVGGFTLNGEVELLDLLGAYSGGITAEPGYVAYDQVEYRCLTITLPLVLDDVWTESE